MCEKEVVEKKWVFGRCMITELGTLRQCLMGFSIPGYR